MRVFKPLQLSLQTKTLQWEQKNHLIVTALLGFPFDSQQEVLLEQDLWKFLQKELGKDVVLDINMPKPQGETVVFGNYYSAGQQAVTADRVHLKMGAVNKEIAVIGNRYWTPLLGPTEPEPIRELPISYEYAFGGKDFKRNPTGKGLDEVDVFGEQRLPLPNIEKPDNLLTSSSQRPDPVGLGPLDIMWEQRADKAGSYDQDWLDNHFPGLALDLNWNYFNVTPPDQWIDGFWQGQESFQILNMHLQKPEVRGQLPGFRVRCFIEKKIDSGLLFTEIEMKAETTFLFPNVETGILLYRGTIEIKEDDATDVEHLILGYENLSDSPRSKVYYEEALRNRLDEKKLFEYMMSTKDIIPDTERCGYARIMDEVGKDDVESELAKNIDARAELEIQKVNKEVEQKKNQLSEKLQASSIDPAPYLEKFDVNNKSADDPHVKEILGTVEKILPGATGGSAKNIKPEDVDFSMFNVLTEQMDAMANTKLEESRQKLKDAIKKVEGSEVEQQVREKIEVTLEQMDQLPDLPRPQADEALKTQKQQFKKIDEAREKMRANGTLEEDLPRVDIELDELDQKLMDSFKQMKELYRTGAHYIEGKPPHTVPMDMVQYRFKKALDKGESLSGKDLSGVDLSNLNLSGFDLSGCYLEYANLTNTKLKGSNLTRAIITHANLTNSDLSNADLREANLGDSQLFNANFTQTQMTGCELGKADLGGARFIDCDLNDINFLETKMAGVDLTGSTVKNAIFINIDFSDGRFIGCELVDCVFLQCTLNNSDFTSAILTGSNFIECKLDGSLFTEALMDNVRFLGGASLTNCNFDKAVLDKASFRDSDASGSRFERASFNQADFSGANLQKTKFYGAVGKCAIFMKSDLKGADFTSVNIMQGSMMKARLTNADLSYSNLYAVEFMGATVGDTDFSGANLDLTKLEDWRPSR